MTLRTQHGTARQGLRSRVAASLATLALAALSLTGAASTAPAAATEPLAATTRAPVDLPGVNGLSRTAQERAVAGYWTPERTAEALRNGTRDDGAGTRDDGTRTAARAAATADARALDAGPGLDPVGKILFNYAGGSPGSCSGTVVNTPAETLVITAGHCLYSDDGWHKNIAFVPAYDGTEPLGVFTAWNIAVDPKWSTEEDERYDYGVVITHDNAAGETAADAAGAFDVAIDRGTVNPVTIVGYPAVDGYDGRHQEFCESISEPSLPPRDVITADCSNMRQGASGGPWLIDYDPAEEIGDIYGVNGQANEVLVTTCKFTQRTLDFVVLMDQLAAARP
ncbi:MULTISPECIES: trypsin-like serine peptidase [unclassified Streptomyces]|uniref:trypsin-like serine peptidase n=1 Tax=unclassified Streptomyces TaxID=2593676 RepID=UPI003D7305E5